MSGSRKNEQNSRYNLFCNCIIKCVDCELNEEENGALKPIQSYVELMEKRNKENPETFDNPQFVQVYAAILKKLIEEAPACS